MNQHPEPEKNQPVFNRFQLMILSLLRLTAWVSAATALVYSIRA